MARNWQKTPLSSWWGVVAFAILALASLVTSRTFRNPVPRQMMLTLAISYAAVALTALCLKYRDRRKTRHQDEDETNPT
jgi:heme A synthase